MTNQLPKIGELLCLGAHADDIEIGCAGTIMRLLESNPGMKVHWVVLCGDQQRKSEARAAFEQVTNGAEAQLHLYDFPDSRLPTVLGDVKDALHKLSQMTSPELILTHRLEDRHQDHRLIAELAWQAFRDHLIWEYEIAKYEGDLGAMNTYVRIPAPLMERKLQILASCFPSQVSKPWFSEKSFAALMRLRAIETGSSAEFAEAFQCRKTIFS